MSAKLDPEDIAYWYLRLNGFLILRNFLVTGIEEVKPEQTVMCLVFVFGTGASTWTSR